MHWRFCSLALSHRYVCFLFSLHGDHRFFVGFADVIREHFRVQRDALLKQCSEWLKLCEDPDEERKLRQAVDKLREELQKLEEQSDEQDGE